MKKNDFYKRNNVYIYIKYGFDGNKIEIRFLVAKVTLEIADRGRSETSYHHIRESLRRNISLV